MSVSQGVAERLSAIDSNWPFGTIHTQLLKCFCLFRSATPQHNPGGGFKYCLFSPRSLGKWSNLTSVFFKWVVQPPTSNAFWFCFFKSSGDAVGSASRNFVHVPSLVVSVKMTLKSHCREGLANRHFWRAWPTKIHEGFENHQSRDFSWWGWWGGCMFV